MKPKKKMKAAALSSVMGTSVVLPMISPVINAEERNALHGMHDGFVPAEPSNNWVKNVKVDIKNFKNTEEAKKINSVIRINKGGENDRRQPHKYKFVGLDHREDAAKIKVYEGVPQLYNQNFSDTDLANNSKVATWTTKTALLPKEYKEQYEGKDYDGNNFPVKFADLDKTIYNHFRATYKGTNFNIPTEVIQNNRDFGIEFKYPDGAEVLTYEQDVNNPEIKIPTYKKIDMYVTLTGFVFRTTGNTMEKGKYIDIPVNPDRPEDWKYGDAKEPHREGAKRNYDIMISSSWNPMSGFKPSNVEAMKVKVQFKDGDKIINSGYLRQHGVTDPQAIFTFGSLNFNGHTGESVAFLNPDNQNTTAYLSSDTHLMQRGYDPSRKKTTHSTYFKYDTWEKDFGSDDGHWGTKARHADEYYRKACFVPAIEIGKEANNFDDFLESSDYHKNAVTFVTPLQDEYQFLLGTHSYAGIGDLYKSVWTDKQYTRMPWEGTNGWQFISSAPLFEPALSDGIDNEDKTKNHPDPYSPIKRVSDDNELNVVKNRIGPSESGEIEYKIQQRVGSIGGDTPTFYKSFMMQDSLPEGLEFLNARILGPDGRDFEGAGEVKFDENSKTVSWNPNQDVLGRIVERDGVRYPKTGLMKMEGETYTMVIRARVKQGYKKIIRNTATTYINGVAKGSNSVETNPNRTPELNILKTVTTPSGTNKTETNPKDNSDSVRDTILGEANTYSLYADIPEDINTYNEFKITDDLDRQLTLIPGSVNAELVGKQGDSKKYTSLEQSIKGQKVEVGATDFNAMKGYSKLKVTFKAKLNEDTQPDTQIPNSAKLIYSNTNGEHGEKDSNVVHVFSERAEDPTVVKDVMGHPDEYFAEKAGRPFEYHIESKLPKNIAKYTQLMITDELDKRIKLVDKEGKPDIKVETVSNTGETKVYKGFQIEHNKNTNKLDVVFSDFGALHNQAKLKVTINATVDSSVKTDERIPNKASISYTSPNATMKTRETKNPVYVWINPSDEPAISKTVDDKLAGEKKIGNEYEYEIPVSLPSNIETYKYIQVTDRLPAEMDYISNSAKTVIDGEEVNWINPQYNGENRTVSYRLESPTKLKDKKKVTLKFKVKLNTKARYLQRVPNIAEVAFKNATMEEEKTKSSKPAVVKPVLDKQNIEFKKTIETDKQEFTVKKNVPFTYNLTVKLPDSIASYKQFKITDKLDRHLDYVDFVSVVADGIDVISNKDLPNPAKDLVYDKNKPLKLDRDTNLLTFEVPADKIKNLDGVKELKIRFRAKANVDDEVINNIGNILVTDDQGITDQISSNAAIVKVGKKPSSTNEDKFILKKTVNGKENISIKDESDNTFTYNLHIAPNKVSSEARDLNTYTEFMIKDELDNRLAFENDGAVKVFTNNKPLNDSDYEVSTKNNVLKVKIKNTENIKEDIDVKFTARLEKKLKKGENVDNKFNIVGKTPNGRDNNGDSTGTRIDEQDSNVSTITNNPSDNDAKATDFILNKLVNGKTEATVRKGESFTYELNTKLPKNINKYRSLAIKDTLDDKLSFTDKKIKVESNGRELANNKYSVDISGKNLKVSIKDVSDVQDNLVVKFDAQLNRKLAKGEKVPNIYSVDAVSPTGAEVKPDVSSPVNITEDDNKAALFDLNKTVNDKTEVSAKKDDVVTYKLNTKLPADIKSYKSLIVKDELDNRLAFADGKNVSVVSKGRELPKSSYKTNINGQKLEVTITNANDLEDEVIVSFKAKINSELSKDEKIPNIYNVEATDESGKVTPSSSSNEVVVSNPTGPEENGETPVFNLHKTVNNKEEAQVKQGDVVTYKLNTSLPKDIKTYKSLSVKDELDNRLSFANSKEISVVSKGKELPKSSYKAVVDGQKLEVKINNTNELEGELEVKFDAKLEKSIADNDKVPNIFEIEAIDGKGKATPTSSSNEVALRNPNGKPEGVKDANDKKDKPVNANVGNNNNGGGLNGTQRNPNGTPINGGANNGGGEAQPLKGEMVKTGVEATRSVAGIIAATASGVMAGAYALVRRKNRK